MGKVGKRVKILLDIEQVLASEELTLVDRIGSKGERVE